MEIHSFIGYLVLDLFGDGEGVLMGRNKIRFSLGPAIFFFHETGTESLWDLPIFPGPCPQQQGSLSVGLVAWVMLALGLRTDNE